MITVMKDNEKSKKEALKCQSLFGLKANQGFN